MNNSWKCNCNFEWTNKEGYYEFKLIEENGIDYYENPNQMKIDFD